jgi:hypothetical protein
MRCSPWPAVVFLLGATACHTPASVRVPPSTCAALGGDAVAFDTARVRELVGTYELALVDTVSVPGRSSVRVGRLRLWAQDSVRILRSTFGQLPAGRGHERPIAGSFVRTPPDTSAWGRRLASEDLDHPGAIWMNGRLRIGDYDVIDGTGYDLVVWRWSRGGFTGWWQNDLGIAIISDPNGRLYKPGGYFCARRLS